MRSTMSQQILHHVGGACGLWRGEILRGSRMTSSAFSFGEGTNFARGIRRHGLARLSLHSKCCIFQPNLSIDEAYQS
jgi:hypothetical protein